MNIIAVDDEQAALDSLMQAIGQAAPGAQLTGYTKAEDALAHAKTQPVDVAFLDMRMAGLDGLGLAERLMALHPQINIIVVTGYSEYALPAHRIHVSGFLEKPVTVDSVTFELSILRNKPKDTAEPRVRVQCFGNFGVFVNGKPVLFPHAKAKELLAYLVHRKGTSASNADIAAILWEDKGNSASLQSNTRTVISQLTKTLREAGIEDILHRARNNTAIESDRISCDYYDYLRDQQRFAHTFHGEYLGEYSWAEPTQAFLNHNRGVLL